MISNNRLLRREGSQRLFRVLALATSLGLAAPAAAQTFNESSYGGDYSNNSAAPTPLTFTVSNNVVNGTTGVSRANPYGDNDYFSFTIPNGDILSSLIVLAAPNIMVYDPNTMQMEQDRVFIGIAQGSSVPPISSFMDSSGNFVTAAGLLGWSLFNSNQIGTNILPALGTSNPANFPPFPGATGFTGPLGPGTYSMWVLDGDGPAPIAYSLSYAVTATPEPATWAMMILGFGIAGCALRYRGRRRVAIA